MLKKIKIEGLFNQFNYEIELKDEGLTILTGPNGYGKTTILKILYAVAVKNLGFFFQFPFKKIVFIQENNKISLSKTEQDTLEIRLGNENPTIYKKSDYIKPQEIRRLLVNSSYQQIDEDHWLDRRTDIIYTMEDAIEQFLKNNPDVQLRYSSKKQMPDFVDVYLIEEQRLLKKSALSARRNYQMHMFDEERGEIFSNTIEEDSKELSKSLKDILANASRVGQELDSSFPRRLFDETTSVSEQEFNIRYNLIKEKQKSLSLYGLSVIQEDTHTSFKEENAKALRVYLHDTEKKLAVFDDVLQKLEIFSSILNERSFAFKRLKISPEIGFRFITEHEKELALTTLSSGEQQEVVLLYELLFRVSPNTLVLIDEPEISLHVAWQKEFLDDLLKIIRLQKIMVITATHSPHIINTHWDLVVDLFGEQSI